MLEASDGPTALATVRAGHPDLIVLDTVMARLSGSDVLAAVRCDPAVAATPVIMLTARAPHPGDATAHYLMKPFSPVELATFVGALLAGDDPASTSPRTPAPAHP